MLFSPRRPHSTEDLESPPAKKMIGECSICLLKLFRDDIYEYDMTHLSQGISFVNVRREKTTEEKFWRKGNQIGVFTAKFQFNSTRFVRQHIIGVRTENGPILLNFINNLLFLLLFYHPLQIIHRNSKRTFLLYKK